jgi:hypothetical protein
VAALRQAGFAEDQIGVAVGAPDPARPAPGPDKMTQALGVGVLGGASFLGLASGTLLGLLAAGAVGGLVAAFIGLGLPEDAARSYQRELDVASDVSPLVSIQPHQPQVRHLPLRHPHQPRRHPRSCGDPLAPHSPI